MQQTLSRQNNSSCVCDSKSEVAICVMTKHQHIVTTAATTTCLVMAVMSARHAMHGSWQVVASASTIYWLRYCVNFAPACCKNDPTHKINVILHQHQAVF